MAAMRQFSLERDNIAFCSAAIMERRKPNNQMPKFTITVTETYTNTFEIDAANTDAASAQAEGMAVEREFPNGHQETCERAIAANLVA